MTPSTLRRFKPSESLYFQFYVYNPRVDEKGTSDVVLQAQIWSEGRRRRVEAAGGDALSRRTACPLPRDATACRLEGLAPGSYELRVVVVDRKANATAFRSVDFTVERADN